MENITLGGWRHIVNSRATFLHDGRAKTILETLMWPLQEKLKILFKYLLETFHKNNLDKLEKFLKSLYNRLFKFYFLFLHCIFLKGGTEQLSSIC